MILEGGGGRLGEAPGKTEGGFRVGVRRREEAMNRGCEGRDSSVYWGRLLDLLRLGPDFCWRPGGSGVTRATLHAFSSIGSNSPH